LITAAGIIASFFSVLCVHLTRVSLKNVQAVLKWQIGISTIFMSGAVYPCISVLPEKFSFANGGAQNVTPILCYGCIMFGLWSGMIIGFITEYYTSNEYRPTMKLVNACSKGPAPNIIQGLALGYESAVIPIFCITATIYFAFSKAGMYGISLSALGMLGSLPVALSIDGYGPISDNAGGVAEMSGLPSGVRDKTDKLDAAGNTTAAVGKGFAIGSACLVGLALFGAFITRVTPRDAGDVVQVVNILKPSEFGGLLIGAMLPYWFSAMTMEAVGDAAQDMMQFIIDDYNRVETEAKKGNTVEPDYQGCIQISTEASLKKMIAPGALVILAPLIIGFLFGPMATAGLLAGAIVSGVQVAISASNTGGAWDNCKKKTEEYRSLCRQEARQRNIDLAQAEEDLKRNPERMNAEAREIAQKMFVLRENHHAAVCGDTVGDPLKDTSGPAINILIKLSAITSLVFGSYI
jgi:inorganic pyrophosphatase